MTICQLRTALVWLVQIALGHETFLFGQFFGFLILVFGTLIYNEIIILPFLMCTDDDDYQKLEKVEG